MCVAFPGKIIAIKENLTAIVDISGVQREVNLGLLDGDVAVGDYVISHIGFAIHKVEKKEAEESLKILNDLLKEPS